MRFVQLTYHRCTRRVMDNRLAWKELTLPAPVEEIAALVRKHLHPRLTLSGIHSSGSNQRCRWVTLVIPRAYAGNDYRLWQGRNPSLLN
jgi:hypothetical protein